MAFTKKQEKEGTMISDWLNEHGNPEIEKKVEREAILKYGEPKQETLEEAAKRLFPVSPQKRKVWLEGAKWQAERMYSEKDMIEFAEWCEIYYSYNQKRKQWYKYADKTDDIKPYTTKELLQLWKEQKPKKVYYEN